MKSLHRNIFLLATCLCWVASLYAAQPPIDKTQLLLKSGTIKTTDDFATHLNDRALSSEICGSHYYRILQFNAMPSESEKSFMASAGIQFLNYIPNNAYIVSISTQTDLNILTPYHVRTVLPLGKEQRMARSLVEKNYPDYAQKKDGTIDLLLNYFRNIPSSDVRLQLEREGLGIIADYPAVNQFHVRVALDRVDHLATLPFVKWLTPVAPPSTPDDTKGRSLHRSNMINSDFVTGRHYDGAGVSISLADDGEVGPHIDFQGRLTNIISSGPGGTHGDMTSGIAAGAGNLNPMYRGMGSGAHMYIHDINEGPDGYDHIYNAPSFFSLYGAVITSTSYSQGCNDYDLYSATGDQLVYDNPQFSFVFSAGNNAGGDCGYGAGSPWGTITGGFKQGKNVIACANLDAYEVLDNSSSHGPSADGRVKPDIASNGADQMSTDQDNTYQVGGGTSAACPGIAGICSQLYQAYRELNSGGNPDEPLIKAVLLNGAEDIGNPGPDFTYGWGRVNALRALQTLEEHRYTLDSVALGETHQFSIPVPAGVGQLKVMVYWLDPQGDPLATTALVNDLDMTVTDPSAVSFNPWVLDPTPTVAALTAPAVRGTDHLNNVEQVTITNASSGTYTVTISGTNVPQGPQRYYIVWEFRTDQVMITYPNGGEGFVPGESEWLRWDAYGVTSAFTLEYSTDNGSTWNVINAAVPAATRQYEWIIPNNVSDRVKVRITRGLTSDVTDDKLAILNVPQNLNIDFACIDTLQLSWSAVSGATSYEVSRLGAMYMDSIATTSATSLQLPVNQSADTWFSVRAIGANQGKGRRTLAIHKSPGLQNCSFAIDAALVNVVSPLDGNIFGCQNLATVPVTLTIRNDGINTISTMDLSYVLNGGTPVVETYSGSLIHGASATYTFTATVDLSVPGPYTLVCHAAYAGDQNSTNDDVVINIVSSATATLPVIEDFQGAFPPTGWQVESSNATYVWSPSASITGSDGNPTIAAWFDNYSYNSPGMEDYLTTMLIDLNGVAFPRIRFDVAYAEYSGYADGLRLDISTDCGVYFNPTSYYKTGPALATVPPSNTDWQPTLASDWRNDTLDLTAYRNNFVLLRFTNVNDYGNNLYLDNINVENDNVAGTGNVVQPAYLTAFPNPSTGRVQVGIRNFASRNLKMTVFDSQGKEVWGAAYEKTGDSFSQSIDLSRFGKGIYMLRVAGDEQVYMLRLTVL